MLAEDEKLETQKNTGISGQDNGVSEHGNIENRITEGKPMGSRGVESRGIDNRIRRTGAQTPRTRRSVPPRICQIWTVAFRQRGFWK